MQELNYLTMLTAVRECVNKERFCVGIFTRTQANRLSVCLELLESMDEEEQKATHRAVRNTNSSPIKMNKDFEKAMYALNERYGEDFELLNGFHETQLTLCHSKTEHLPEITKQADIVISAVGKPNFITADMIAHGAVVIDVGINRTDDGKLVGDVCFDDVQKIAGAITPVPGGVGIMTVTMLLNNTYIAALAQSQFKNRENKRSSL